MLCAREVCSKNTVKTAEKLIQTDLLAFLSYPRLALLTLWLQGLGHGTRDQIRG